MIKIIHICVDIRGAIMRLSQSRAKMAPGMSDDNGRPLTRLQAIDALMCELAKGRKVLPMGNDCVGFDYQTGCPGHQVEEGA